MSQSVLVIRVFLVLYGTIALGTGVHAAGRTYDTVVAPMADNSQRFVAAMWASMALGFFYAAWNPSSTDLFRFLMIALFIGGIVRTAALVHYPPSPAIVAAILLELIPTPMLLWMHTRLLSVGAL